MSKELAKATKADETLLWMMGQMEKRGTRLDDLLHPDMPKERFLESCRLAFGKNPDLMDAKVTDLASVLQATLLGARSGLDVHGHFGHLVSFNNTKAGLKSVSFMPDYKGLIAVWKAAGVILDAEAVVVYEADAFVLEEGDERRLQHTPFIRRKPTDTKGGIIAAYMRYLLPGGRWVVKGILLLEDIERIESGVKAKNGPWGGPHRPEMIKKSSCKASGKWMGATTADRATTLRLAALEEAQSQEEAIEGEWAHAPQQSVLTGVAGAKASLQARNSIPVTLEATPAKEPVSAIPSPEEQAEILAQEMELQG